MEENTEYQNESSNEAGLSFEVNDTQGDDLTYTLVSGDGDDDGAGAQPQAVDHVRGVRAGQRPLHRQRAGHVQSHQLHHAG